MTYYSKYSSYSYTKSYEWTAYTEADFLGPNTGSSIGCGDKFTMPGGGATVCMSTYDNDRYLSGDASRNENADDSYGQKAYIDGEREGGQMYAERYHVLKGSDGKTYYLIEIEVEGYDAPGAGDDFFTFYGAVPPAGVELSVVQTSNVKGCMIDYRCLGAGEKAPANTPPEFTNEPKYGKICIDENTKFVIDLNANDADGDTLTYEIIGGADADKFEIDAATGELSFKEAPDFENPTDHGQDNVYDVQVRVTDGKGGEDTTRLSICVEDVQEGQPKCIVIEAEDMYAWGFSKAWGSNASGGKLMKLDCAGGEGVLWTQFTGEEGNYDLKLYVQDENDGQSTIHIKVNDTIVKTIVLDGDNNGSGNDNGYFTEITLDDIDLKPGDYISIWADGNCGEYVRIDKIELCKDDQPLGSIGDKVWFDADRDGVQDAGEAGVAGVTVNLLDAGGNVIATEVTNGDGDYLFSDLAAGDYKVQFDLPDGGFGFTSADQGDDATDSDVINAAGETATITLAAGENNTTVDAGLVELLGSIGDRVWLDADGDGVQDAGEAGVAGVTVNLLDAGGNVIATEVTNGDGDYLFADLSAGDYKVQFDLPAGGFGFTSADQGDDATDSDVINAAGETATITLAAGENNTTVDAGLVELPGSLSGKYFIDADKDGLDNDGTNGVAGVQVELLDAAGVGTGITTTTDADGNYSFAGLAAGSYGVKFTDAVTGFVLTTQDVDGNVSDDIDSDASDLGGGMSQITGITVVAGQNTPDNDAGVFDPNNAPDPMDDEAKTCADEEVTVDVLANDVDLDGDTLVIKAINGVAIAEGETVTTAAGTHVTLVGGELVIDGEDAYAALDIGEQDMEVISYTVADGNGGEATANLTMTFCGDANTLESFCASLPATAEYQIRSDDDLPLGDYAFEMKITDSGDARFDGVVFQNVYCLAYNDPIEFSPSYDTAPLNFGSIASATDVDTAALFNPEQISVYNGLTAAENFDLITWIVDQNFEGNGYTGWEVQRAIWELTDSTDQGYLDAFDYLGSDANVQEILTLASANEGYTSSFANGTVGMIVDPGDADPANTQPFIVSLAIEQYDCLC